MKSGSAAFLRIEPMIPSTRLQKTFHIIGSLLAAAWVAGAAGTPAVRLAGIFGDNMVLQQGAITPVWGWGEPDQEVEVSIAGQSARATTGPDCSAHRDRQMEARRARKRVGV